MTSLILQVTITKAFPGEAEAVRALAALAGILVRASLRGGLWTELASVRFELSAETFEREMGAALGIRADLPRQPTHVFPVLVAARGAREIGSFSISVRDPAPEDSFPGLSALVELTDDAFDIGAPALQELLARCAEVLDASSVMIGPRRWVRKEGIAWAFFAKESHRDRLPADSRIVKTRSGVVVVTHAEDPASESTSARESARRAGQAMLPEPPPVPLERTLGSAEVGLAEAGRVPSVRSPFAAAMPASAAVPSFMAATSSKAGAKSTMAVPVVAMAPERLPFDSNAEVRLPPGQGPQRQSGLTADVDLDAILKGARGPGRAVEPAPAPAPVVSPPGPAPSPSPAGIGQTVDVDISAIARAVLSFGPAKPAGGAKPAPEPGARQANSANTAPPRSDEATGESAARSVPMVPVLTLQQYASLSVDIELSPAQIASVLHRYGANEAGKAILDARWARALEEQPAQRAALEEAKAHYRAWLSSGGLRG